MKLKLILSKLLIATLTACFSLLIFWPQSVQAASWIETLPQDKREILNKQPEEVVTYFERYFDPNTPEAINVSSYKKMRDDGSLLNLPIGVFDSGTGGLAVLEALKKVMPKNETYIFYADQANMPWGEYPINQKRTDTLKEIMMGIYQWLLTTKFDISTKMDTSDKKSVKAIIVACNTATAYSLKLAKDVLQLGHEVLDFPSIPVYGIIEAGAAGAIQKIAKSKMNPKGISVAVFATAGTVDAGAYPIAFDKFTKESNITNLSVYQQAGIGVAGAIDQSPEFIDLNAKDFRNNYLGPNASFLMKQSLPLNSERWKYLNFSMGPKGNGVFVKKEGEKIVDFQLNSVENYIRFSVVLLLEKMLQNKETKPLKVVVFGCTHYPYFQGTFVKIFKELRNFKSHGTFLFRHLIDSKMIIIDPSEILAAQIKEDFTRLKLERKTPILPQDIDQFFISMPKEGLASSIFVNQDPKQGFTSEYKHGREVAHGKRIRQETVDDIARVPMGLNNVDSEVVKRLKSRVPVTFESMKKSSDVFLKANLDKNYRAF